MRRSLVLCALLACHVDPRFDTLHMEHTALVEPERVTSLTLASGLRVALLGDPRASLVTIDLRYEVGAADDPRGEPGLALAVAHLLAHAPLHDRGNGNGNGNGNADGGALPDPELTAQLAVELDHTTLSMTTLEPAAALELAARRLETTCADFDAPTLALARTEAVASVLDLPTSLAAAIWGDDHPYAQPIGAATKLAAASPDELCAFYSAHYAPTAATLVVTGPIDSELIARIHARFDKTAPPAGHAVARVAIAPVQPTQAWARVPIVGLTRPTAMLVFPLPPATDPDELVVEAAMRRLGAYDNVHVAIIGGDRARALVVSMEAENVAKLDRANDTLTGNLLQASTAVASEEDDAAADAPTADDQLGVAQQLDDVFARGALIARRRVTAGAPVRMRHVADLTLERNAARRWIAHELALERARRIDALPIGTPYGPAEVLAASPIAIDRALARSDGDAPIAAIVPVPRPVEHYALANGLRVVLAPDPDALAVDLRLVVPVGTRNDPAPGVAQRAAVELVGDDGWSFSEAIARRLEWYATLAAHTTVEVNATTTRFRKLGRGNDVDWHAFGLAWMMTTGRYTSDASKTGREALEQFRRTAYRPDGATLFVTGRFDATAIRPRIATWFGDWRAPIEPAPAASTARGRATVIAEANDADVVEAALTFRPRVPASTTALRAARMIVASLVRERLDAVFANAAEIGATYQPRADETFEITAQLDPAGTAASTAALVRELGRLRDVGPTADELAHARRRAIAEGLAGSVGVSERALQLQQAVELGVPLDELGRELDRELDAMRTVTAADVRAAAVALLEPDGEQLAVRGPRAAIAGVFAALGVDPRAITWRHAPDAK